MHFLHSLADWGKVCEDCAGQAGLSFLAVIGVMRWVGLDALGLWAEFRGEKAKIAAEEKEREAQEKASHVV